MQTGSL